MGVKGVNVSYVWYGTFGFCRVFTVEVITILVGSVGMVRLKVSCRGWRERNGLNVWFMLVVLGMFRDWA